MKSIANTLSHSSNYRILTNSVQIVNEHRVTQSALLAWSRADPQDAAA
jgi:hypothetical protein